MECHEPKELCLDPPWKPRKRMSQKDRLEMLAETWCEKLNAQIRGGEKGIF